MNPPSFTKQPYLQVVSVTDLVCLHHLQGILQVAFCEDRAARVGTDYAIHAVHGAPDVEDVVLRREFGRVRVWKSPIKSGSQFDRNYLHMKKNKKQT